MSDLSPVIAALRRSLDADPRQPELWLHLAGLLAGAADPEGAIDALRNAERVGAAEEKVLPSLLPLLRARGNLAEALIRVEQALSRRGSPVLELELVRILAARGDRDDARERYRDLLARDPALADPALAAELGSGAGGTGVQSPQPKPATPSAPPPAAPTSSRAPPERELAGLAEGDEGDIDRWARQFDWGDLGVRFADVVGLEEVKRQIRLRIIAPLEKGHLMRAFGRKGGGGILLYGPPGCGKTYLARATAGEVSARFVAVGIHEVLDKWFGESEKMIHALFEEARRRAPTVLFFDEFDAFATGRRAQASPFYQTLVDQLLQEMDGMAGDNENVLVCAATNVPWHVDAAFRRPGRFDRQFFVPPPDRPAREEYLARTIRALPGGEEIRVERLAKESDLFTFADLKALCERASDRALERTLETGEVHPVTAEDFHAELPKMRSSSAEWLASAKNYARYANEGGQYDDLKDFLRKVGKG